MEVFMSIFKMKAKNLGTLGTAGAFPSPESLPEPRHLYI